MSRKRTLTDEQRASNKRAHQRRATVRFNAIVRGIYNQIATSRQDLLDEGEELIAPEAVCNRIDTNLGEGARWHRPRKGMA